MKREREKERESEKWHGMQPGGLKRPQPLEAKHGLIS